METIFDENNLRWFNFHEECVDEFDFRGANMGNITIWVIYTKIDSFDDGFHNMLFQLNFYWQKFLNKLTFKMKILWKQLKNS